MQQSSWLNNYVPVAGITLFQHIKVGRVCWRDVVHFGDIECTANLLIVINFRKIIEMEIAK